MSLLLCTQCGADLTPGQRFCSQCGTPTPAPMTEAPAADGPWEAILSRLRGAVAPKYQVRRLLGQGGMAGVYLADEPKLGRQVAIKVMAPGLMVDPKLVERFAQEARTIAQLRHANIVTVYEVDERDGLHYFAMDYVPGRTLGQVMNEADRPLSIPVIKAWLYQVGDALAYAHSRGVVHRDIKPGNVLLDLSGNALVTDFGIAKVTEGGQGGLTRTGMLVGTPAYMSPEQCAGESVTGASDQYALGAVAYQLLTGRPPFVGPTMTVLHAHMSQPPRPVGEIRGDCPDRFQEAVMRMLAKRPEDRFPSISAAISAAGATPPGFDDPVRISVVELAKPAASLDITNAPDAMVEGTQQQLEVLVRDAKGGPLGHRKIDWRTSDDETAVVATANMLIALAPGEAKVKASSGGARAVLELTVEPDPIVVLRIVPSTLELATGARHTLAVEGQRADGRVVTRAAHLSSENPEVARVDAEGVVVGVSVGQAVIRARSGGLQAEAIVTVADAVSIPEPRLEVTPALETPPDPTPVPESDPAVDPVLASESEHYASVVDATPAPARTPSAESDEVESTPTPEALPPKLSVLEAPRSMPPATASRRPMPVVAAVAGVVLLAVAAVAFQVLRGGAPTPPDPEPALLQLDGSLPPGAVVVVRDSAGNTTLADAAGVSLAAGAYTIEVEAAGYSPWSETIQLANGERRSLTPRLVSIEPTVDSTDVPTPTTGTLQIAGSLPNGARISVSGPDGEVQSLDGRVAVLEPGRYTVHVTATGHRPWTGQVNVQSGETTSVTPAVRPEPAPSPVPPEPEPQPQPGRLQISGDLPPGATVTVQDAQGARVAMDGRSASVQAGSYTVRVDAQGYESWNGTARVQAGQTANVTPQLRRVATPPPPQPGPDPEADQAGIRAAIQQFATAFNRRDAATVVPLLPADQQDAWRDLLGRRDVADFSTQLRETSAARLDNDIATVPVDLAISFVASNQRVRETLRWTATLARAGDGWRITSLRRR